MEIAGVLHGNYLVPDTDKCRRVEAGPLTKKVCDAGLGSFASLLSV